jgi:hypothetical protein
MLLICLKSNFEQKTQKTVFFFVFIEKTSFVCPSVRHSAFEAIVILHVNTRTVNETEEHAKRVRSALHYNSN